MRRLTSTATRPILQIRTMPRLFTGLEIPADVAQSLSMLRGGLPGARWIDPRTIT